MTSYKVEQLPSPLNVLGEGKLKCDNFNWQITVQTQMFAMFGLIIIKIHYLNKEVFEDFINFLRANL